MRPKDELIKKSRPAWARGLKLAVIGEVGSGKTVAPRMGAWIETNRET